MGGIMLWGRRNDSKKYWLSRFNELKRRSPKVRNEVMSKMRRTQQLYDNGRLEDSWRVASDAKMFFQSYSNEVTEAMTQVQRWGVRLSGLNEVIDPMLRTQHDLDLLESYLREEIRAMQLIEEKRAR